MPTNKLDDAPEFNEIDGPTNIFSECTTLKDLKSNLEEFYWVVPEVIADLFIESEDIFFNTMNEL